MLVKELFESRKLLEGVNLEIYDELLPLLQVNEEDGPMQPPAQGGGWGPGPFRPGGGMNGNHWFNELYTSIKSYAVATRMSNRLKVIGLKGAGVDRVNIAKKTALKNTKDLLTNPFATAYKIPSWTTKNTMPKIAIKMWNEEIARQFANELSKIEIT